MRTIIGLLTALIFVLPVCSCRQGSTSAQVTGSVVEISDSLLLSSVADTFRLGKLRHGETVVKEFFVKNAADAPFLISNVDSDCGCIMTQYDRSPLRPGESRQLAVSFDSRGYRGFVVKKIEVLTSLNRKPLVIFIEATVQ